VTAGQRNEQTALPTLLDRGAVKRPRRGRPRVRPKRLAGDKGYASAKARAEVRRRGIVPVIPTKSDERRNPRFDRAAYRQRNKVERLVNRLKQHRAIATRYEKLAVHYEALVTIGCILLWL
jgi:transposase